MGGKNCPPPLTDRPMPGVREAYITSLAEFCRAIFSGAEHYYGAHAKIENAVLTESDLGDAIDQLKHSEVGFENAQSKVGAVASLYEQLGGNDVDFGTQLEYLAAVVAAISAVRMELEVLDTEHGVQSSLWSQPNITNGFATATYTISECMAWQTEFAQRRTLVAA